MESQESQFSYKAELDSFPGVRLADPTQIQIVAPEVSICTEAEVQNSLEALQIGFAHFEFTQAPAQLGDQVLLDLYATYQGRIIPHSPQCDRLVLLRSNIQATASESAWLNALIGLKSGQKLEIPYQLPDDYPQVALRGKEAISHVTVKSVSRGKLAEFDDLFAQALGFETIEALQADLATQINLRHQTQWQQYLKEAVLTAFVDLAELDIPFEWVQQELEQSFRTSDEHCLRALGIDVAQIDALKRSWYGQSHLLERIQLNIKTQWVLRAWIEQRDLTISDQELETTLSAQASELDLPLPEILEKYRQGPKGMALVERMLIAKALDQLFQAATIVYS